MSLWQVSATRWINPSRILEVEDFPDAAMTHVSMAGIDVQPITHIPVGRFAVFNGEEREAFLRYVRQMTLDDTVEDLTDEDDEER